jgi:hypothetical protein
MPAFYWERHPNGPFATLIAVATSYLHPEIDDDDGLKRFAKNQGNQESQVFKSELREAVKNPGKLPAGELFASVQYEDGSDEAFLSRLWRDLYGDETP